MFGANRRDRKAKPENSGKYRWAGWGLLVCFLGAAILSSFYGVLREKAEKQQINILEQQRNVSWLYENSILLYRDLYNAQNESQLSYIDIYLKPKETYEWLLDEEKLSKVLCDEEISDKRTEDSGLAGGAISVDEADFIQVELQEISEYFMLMEKNFPAMNRCYDYVIQDNKTQKYVTNMSAEDAENMLGEPNYKRYFWLTLNFDSEGNVSLGKVLSENPDELRRTANGVIREKHLMGEVADMAQHFGRYGKVCVPVDCTVIFATSADKLTTITRELDGDYVVANEWNSVSLEDYRRVGLNGILVSCIFLFFFLGLLLPVLRETKPWNDTFLCSLPFEILFVLGAFILSVTSLVEFMLVTVASGSMATAWMNYMQLPTYVVKALVAAFNLAVLTLFFFGFWYLGICARAVIDKGFFGYIRERSLIYRIFPFLKEKALAVYSAVEHLDLTKDANRIILKTLLVNGVILFIISLLWVGGIIMIVVYSVVLYFILRKYVSDLQKRYAILLEATNQMAEGNLNVTISEDLGVFEPFKPHLIRIQEGFKKAVDAEVSSQKMKAELITNVSHDLKTPLTAIITYVNLLQEEAVTEEQRKEYLSVLERKSLRLKVLIEDLFEVSKANSGNITLNLNEVDIVNLVKQVACEASDKLAEAGLEMRMNLPEEKLLLSLDSQKTYRIYENLFGNIVKYAMKGTRVYVSGVRTDDKLEVTLKNISDREIAVDSTDLTERFVRGDSARNTEGSGLGLAIAKSFTELQGGKLTLDVDGDLFKVTTSWPI